jgi:hypothetical protein
MGLNMPEFAVMSFHRDPRMLFRYTHLRAGSLLPKINSRLAKIAMPEILIDISALWLRAFLILTIIIVALALVFMSYK